MRVVLLNGGGLDSLGCAAILKSQGCELYHLFINYGQKSAEMELRAAAAMVRQFGADLQQEMLPLKFLGQTSPLMREVAVDQQPHDDGKDHTNIIIPQRNVILLALASSYAEIINADAIAVGFDRLDRSGVCPDTNRDMLLYLEAGFQQARVDRRKLPILTPVAGNTKLKTYTTAKRLGADMTAFYSCYVGKPEPCGVCTHCSDYEIELGRRYLDRK